MINIKFTRRCQHKYAFQVKGGLNTEFYQREKKKPFFSDCNKLFSPQCNNNLNLGLPFSVAQFRILQCYPGDNLGLSLLEVDDRATLISEENDLKWPEFN